jgi:hypothetical protein
MKFLRRAFAAVAANAALEVYSKLGKALTKTFPVGALVLTVAVLSLTSRAATFTVTGIGDTGTGTLRQAITDANNAAGTDTIVFSPNLFGSGQQIINISSELQITSDITIDGSNAKSLTINGGSAVRIFNITNSAVQIKNLTIFGGRVLSPANGGGILINGGSTTLSNIALWNCSSTANGGGIYLAAGNLTMQNSTLFANSANLQGGGLFIDSANAAAAITSSTFVTNNGSQAGGAVSVANGTVSAGNSIFANNFGTTAVDFSGTLNSLGFNIIKNTTGTTITGMTNGNQLGVDPVLSFFIDNGGGSFSNLPLNTSPAIDAATRRSRTRPINAGRGAIPTATTTASRESISERPKNKTAALMPTAKIPPIWR